MKFKFLLISCLLFCFKTTHAQFTLKANLPSLVFNNLSLSGEYVFNDNNSLSLSAGFHYPKGTLFPAADVKQWRYNLRGYFINPEFRFYVNHEANHGFYLGPYLRYSHLTSKWNGKISYDSVNLVDYTVKLKLTEKGIGLQFGYNFRLSDRLSLDFAFGGLRFSWFDFSGNFTGLIDEKAILDVIGIDGLDQNGLFGLGQMLFNFINDKATVHLPFGFVMLRTALSIGYTF